jgi:hypothetical protein
MEIFLCQVATIDGQFLMFISITIATTLSLDHGLFCASSGAQTE